jgi:hypothetical protein
MCLRLKIGKVGFPFLERDWADFSKKKCIGIAASREKLVEMFQSMIDYDIADREGIYVLKICLALISR